MQAIAVLAAAEPATEPTPGPDAVADLWPLVTRAAWFAAAALVVLIVGRYAVEPTVVRVVNRRNPNNPTVREAIRRYLRLVVVLVAGVVGIAAAGFGHVVASSALVVAAATLVVGVAAQVVIGSLVSGLVLVGDPEFNVGDYIRWADGEGEVQTITLRVTRVETPDGELMTVPNSTLTGQPVVRPYARDSYRVVEHVGLAYEDDVDQALEHLREAATGLEGVRRSPGPRAYVDDFGSDAVVVRVHYWVEVPGPRAVFQVRSQFARAAKERLEGADITISPASKRELRGRVEVESAN